MAINRDNFIAGVVDDYDERLLERRLTAEGNVCGCLLKNLDLYEDCGLDVLDFVTGNGRLLFLMAKKLREKGIQKFDEVTFVSSLEPDFVKMVENTLGDYNQVYNVMEAVNDKNWDSFLDELNKSNVQLRLYKKGFALFQKIELDNGKFVVPFDFFKNLSSNEVLEFYEGVITSMQTKVQNFKLVEEGYIDFDDRWLESLKNGEEMGVSYGEAGEDINGNEIRTFPFMSANTLGLKPGTLSAWGAFSGTGKTTYMVTVAMSLVSKGEKVVMVTNESRLSELNAIFLSWIIYRVFGYYNISKRKIISGRFTDEEFEVCKKAQQYWREHYAKKIKIEVLSDADTKFSCQLIKRAILREAASVFIVDTMKMTISDGPQDNSWMSLIKDVRALTEIAMRYNVIGIFTLQLAMSASNKCWLDGSCLANCKQMKETLSNLVLFRKLYGPELDPESPYFIKPFRRKQNENGQWYDEPYDADPSKQWIIAFSDKTRRGIDSGMDGTAFLCRTDLDHASFYETARCYPTRKLIGEERRS
mgnify:CR=1 FL=1